MDKKEMADLFAFLYFIRYMDEPGDSQKGRKLMETKDCVKCHSVKEGMTGDLSRWGMYTNPIVWAQMMWNHSPQMEQEMRKKGLSWVEFNGNEMVDLIAYIRSVSPEEGEGLSGARRPQDGREIVCRKGMHSVSWPRSRRRFSEEKRFSKDLSPVGRDDVEPFP